MRAALAGDLLGVKELSLDASHLRRAQGGLPAVSVDLPSVVRVGRLYG